MIFIRIFSPDGALKILGIFNDDTFKLEFFKAEKFIRVQFYEYRDNSLALKNDPIKF